MNNNNKLELILAESNKELNLARNLRFLYLKDIYKEKNHIKNELYRDKVGKVFLFKHKEEIIATVRLVPIGMGLTMTEQLGKEQTPRANTAKTWEIGRLVIKPKHRGLPILKDCLAKVAEWLKDNTDVAIVLAACKTRFISLYQRFGFQVISKDSNSNQASNDASYLVIKGNLPNVIERLGAVG